MHRAPEVSTAHPEVLIVSTKSSDQDAVLGAVQPRGYKTRHAASATAGLKSLEDDPGRIGFVVIDGDMAGAQQVINAAKLASPSAHLVVLKGQRGPETISLMLIAAGLELKRPLLGSRCRSYRWARRVNFWAIT